MHLQPGSSGKGITQKQGLWGLLWELGVAACELALPFGPWHLKVRGPQSPSAAFKPARSKLARLLRLLRAD